MDGVPTEERITLFGYTVTRRNLNFSMERNIRTRDYLRYFLVEVIFSAISQKLFLSDRK